MIKGLLGIIDKMRIEAYPTKDFKVGEPKTVFVQLNPEKYTMKHNVVYCEGQAMGTTGSDLKFNKIEGEEVTFDFLFDSSGVVPPPKFTGRVNDGDNLSGNNTVSNAFMPAVVNPFEEAASVEEDVMKFKDLLMAYNGDTHQPPYLLLIWGGYNLSCRLKSMDIEYTLFRKDGCPIRAKVKCLFKGTVEYKLMAARQNKSSPDLTHQRIVKMNDRLPLMAESIYQSNGYYIDVAKNNKLLTFRKLNTGETLQFQPVK